MPSGSGGSHSVLPIPGCRIRTARLQIQITAQTKHHRKKHTHTHTHTTNTQMLWENTLIAVCGCQSNFFSLLCLSNHYLFPRCLLSPNLPHGATPHPPPMGQLRSIWRCLEMFINAVEDTADVRQQHSSKMETTADVTSLVWSVEWGFRTMRSGRNDLIDSWSDSKCLHMKLESGVAPTRCGGKMG